MARPTEPDISQTNAASFMPTEYAGNDPASAVEIGSLRSVRNRAGIIQGNYVAPPVLLPGNPWLDMNYGAHNGDVGALAWTRPPNLPYDVVDDGPTFLAPVPPTGFRLYRPHRREIILDANSRNRNLPHLRVLPEDELLALGEQIGSVGTGLSEEFIQNNLKIRTYTSTPARINLEYATCPGQQKINFCVVCQTDYEHEENIGTLDCGHEYHRDCIKKWLVVKNTCPVCKSTALSGKGKDL
ncbi:hypothetical protein DH2020_031708 [Rehmannia glutinosa]|uniref:RING-type E3 ubiquitin transferase n=1 Tax=Rehmannia glutinosa TaxID=99300 RepID=A0ABR0VIW4_REHGL